MVRLLIMTPEKKEAINTIIVLVSDTIYYDGFQTVTPHLVTDVKQNVFAATMGKLSIDNVDVSAASGCTYYTGSPERLDKNKRVI